MLMPLEGNLRISVSICSDGIPEYMTYICAGRDSNSGNTSPGRTPHVTCEILGRYICHWVIVGRDTEVAILPLVYAIYPDVLQGD